MNTKQKCISSIIILVASFMFQVTLQSFMRPHAIDGFYFQRWSSETLMQTVSIADLQNAPIETLLNIHIQPLGLDLIRTIIVHALPKPNAQMSLVQHVDYWLYKTWAFLYGVLGSTLFLWIFEITQSKLFSIISTIIFLLHPASIFYATLLDSTLLTSVLVLIFYYFLWRKKKQAWFICIPNYYCNIGPFLHAFNFPATVHSYFQHFSSTNWHTKALCLSGIINCWRNS